VICHPEADRICFEKGVLVSLKIYMLKTKLLTIFILLIVLVSSGVGCDRQVIIRGKVYEWINPPPGTKSRIFHKGYTSQGLLNEDMPTDADLQPLEDVVVRCYGKFKADTFYSNEITNSKGEFKLVISLGQITEDYSTTLEVIKTGYQSVKREIIDTGSDHTVNVILIKE
jgi:hypothetical protein